MATITASRFALLNVDDDYDSDENQKKGKQNAKQAGQQPNQAKKKNKKKKKIEQQKENEELRSLAFAKGVPGKGKGQGAGGTGPSMSVLSTSQRSSEDRPDLKEKQWDTWQKADKELTADAYEKDLEQALLASKLEFEEHKQVKTAVGEENGKGPSHKGKKKKKDKPATMSLEEFQQNPDVDKVKPDENGAHGDGFDEEKPKPTTSIAEPDPKFFDNVHKDAQKVIRKEQIQEEYRKQYIVENARTQQYQDDIEKRDAKIKKLRDKNIKLEGELKEVKERNKQLCHILAQGEMKEKTNVLMELNELKQVRDELTEEVSNLTSELEKERSKNHALKSAAEKHDKSKGGKHSK